LVKVKIKLKKAVEKKDKKSLALVTEVRSLWVQLKKVTAPS